ncbi:MAG: hypothetical protein WC807_17650 [Hyphomicrobium sp.]|jgi:hypothetical protein
MTRPWPIFAIAALFVGFSLQISKTSAQDRGPSEDYSSGIVTAESRYGNGSIRAAVRGNTLGWEVQLPGGRWIFCRRSCSETLRVETVDFFESNAAGSGQLTNECGVFGCLDLKYHP